MVSNKLAEAYTNNQFINKELEIYGKIGPVTESFWQVLSLFDNLFQGIKILVADDKNAVKEVLEILEKNPQEKLIIFAPKIIVQNIIHEFGTDLMKLMKYHNVRVCENFFDFIPDMTKLAQELKEIQESKTSSYLTINEFQKNTSIRILGILQHDLKGYVIQEKGEKYKQIIKQARELFDIKPETPDENVENFILNAKREVTKVMDGDIFGVYCDIDDTILDGNNQIIEKTLELIQNLENEGKEIIIWTGGDLSEAKNKLKGTPFEKYKLVSKYDYSGASAEVIIDNVSPEKFFIQT
ncbi:HAD hydrolase family protein, partial [Candidatus Gracilibacteria bacterium]|nr:HAD hydrolase family protein [Candidatus Gracilibacteria bacterium]